MDTISDLESPLEIDAPSCFQSSPIRTSLFKGSLNASHINYEEYRLRTFKSWPVQAPIQPDRLAKAGFYYLGNDLEVVCFSCGGKISDWTYGDIAMQKHSTIFPKCNFVNNQSSNVPLSSRLPNTENQNVRANASSSPQPNGDLRPSSSLTYPGISVSRENQRALSVSHMGHNKEFLSRMKYETERLRTFWGKWPRHYIKPEDLAQAGFFYLQITDKVQCPFCFGILTNWEPGDKPYVEHIKQFPTCAFVMGRNVGNIPRGEDVCGLSYPRSSERLRMPNSAPENRHNVCVEDLETMGVAVHSGPHNPSQASKDARLRSFLSWPQHAPVKGETLAEAGFFYVGLNDNTKCFYCDGGLSNWEPGDDPWVEHARWFPNCAFVRLNKGGSFIKECLAKGRKSPQRLLPTLAQRRPTSSLSETEISSSSGNSSFSDSENSVQEVSQPMAVVTPLEQKVNDLMRSNLVEAFLKTSAYPAHVVRLAILRKIQGTGEGVHNVHELCEAIHNIRSSQSSPVSLENGIENTKQEVPLPVPETEDYGTSSQKSTKSESDFSLEEENRLLKEQRLCKICMDQEVGVVFLPCGHLIACVQCAPAFTDCALCRSKIKGTIRTFLA